MLVRGIDWTGGLEDAWSSVAEFIPDFAAFLVILLIGWFIAKIVSKVLDRALHSEPVTRLLDRAGLDRFAEVDPVGLIVKLVYYGLLLIALSMALDAFGPNPVSDIVDDIITWLPNAVVAVVIIIVVAAVANAVSDIVGQALAGKSYGPLLTKIVAGFIIALGIIAALNQIGVGVTVTTPVLVAVLATVGGILVVGVGGALISVIKPYLERWVANLNQPSAGTTTGAAGTTTTTRPTGGDSGSIQF